MGSRKRGRVKRLGSRKREREREKEKENGRREGRNVRGREKEIELINKDKKRR